MTAMWLCCKEVVLVGETIDVARRPPEYAYSAPYACKVIAHTERRAARSTSVLRPDRTSDIGDGLRRLHVDDTHDTLGRRVGRTTLRLAQNGETAAERVHPTWDGTPLCEQTTTSAALPNPVTLTWDHQGLRPVSQTERITAADASQEEIDSRFFAIVTDLVGTPTELVDEQGHIAWRTRSTLWGTTAWATDSTTYTPLRFPGQYYDPETGLHYNYFRHYDPATARYLSPDPLGLAPAPNPAAYVRNPFTWADPLGLAPDYPKGENGNPFDKREEADRSAFEVAGVPYGTAPDAEWIVMGDKTLRHMPGHVHSPDATHRGNFRQFETENGSRVVVEHTHDPTGPHFRAGAPKGFTAEDRARNGVNFGWDKTERGYGTMERYRSSMQGPEL